METLKLQEHIFSIIDANFSQSNISDKYIVTRNYRQIWRLIRKSGGLYYYTLMEVSMGKIAL